MASEPTRIKNISMNLDKSPSEVKVLEIHYLQPYTRDEYSMEDNKELEKFIDDVEKDCRGSFEYQEMIKYFRENMNMDRCSFMSGITNKESTKMKIHIHHSPITLYEIVVTVLEKRKFYHESLEKEDVAKECVYAHYCLLIGLIPLCETIHQLVHNKYLFIPNDAVMGGYSKFIDMYSHWIPNPVKNKLERIEQHTNLYNEAENMGILQPNYVFVDMMGTYKLPKTSDLLDMLNNRMELIKNNGYSLEPKPLVCFYDEYGNLI